MNNIFSRNRVFCLVGLASLALLGNNGSVVAQTTTTTNQRLTQALNRTASPQQAENLVPVPGTTATSSAALVSTGATPAVQPAQAQPTQTQVAQADINPGRSTRGGSSYIGVAGNIGIGGGDSALGDGNFAVISKVGLTRGFSVRPSAVFGDNTAILIPVTYDFSLESVDDPFSEPLAIAPYVGAGVAIKTNNDAAVAFLVSGGVDFPLTPQFTATAAINAGFFDQTDIGLLVGVGYNFRR